MKLQKIKYQNFKGIKSFELAAGGEDIAVHGANETGKTTLMDGVLWLLTGKDSAGRADFAIKPLDADGNERHNLDVTVEAEFITATGAVTLEKTLKEKWVKQRGKAAQEFQGHETKYTVDGVPKKKKEYDEAVARLIGSEQTYQLLTDPHAFARLHWKERRALIIEICGDVPDADIIAGDRKLAGLKEILKTRSIDDHRAVVAARRKEINDRMKEIPARIDELSNSLPAAVDMSALQHDLANTEQERVFLEEEKKRIAADGGAADRSAKIAALKAELNNIVEDHRATLAKEAGKVRDEIDRIERNRRKADSRQYVLFEAERTKAETITEREKRLAQLSAEFDRIDSESFAFTDTTTCPTCGQAIPEDQVQDARQKAEAAYNTEKAARLSAINREGKETKAALEKLTEETKAAEIEKETVGAQIEALKVKTDALNETLKSIQNRPMPARWEDAKRDLVALESEKPEHADTSKIDAQIKERREKEAAIKKQIAEQEAGEKSRVRIAELEAEEKRLAAEYETLEGELALLDAFTVAKVGATEARVAEKFTMARFKMFDRQINGGIAETCQITYRGVPWDSLNNAASINVGLDIINTMGRHYGFTPPVCVDNAESITDIISTEAQQIRLYVDAKADTLTIK